VLSLCCLYPVPAAVLPLQIREAFISGDSSYGRLTAANIRTGSPVMWCVGHMGWAELMQCLPCLLRMWPFGAEHITIAGGLAHNVLRMLVVAVECVCDAAAVRKP
jgi:hypothetical protein